MLAWAITLTFITSCQKGVFTLLIKQAQMSYKTPFTQLIRGGHTAKASRRESSFRGKGSAPGRIPKLGGGLRACARLPGAARPLPV